MYSFSPITNNEVFLHGKTQCPSDNGFGSCHGMIGSPLFDDGHVSDYQLPLPSGFHSDSLSVSKNDTVCSKTPLPLHTHTKESKPNSQQGAALCKKEKNTHSSACSTSSCSSNKCSTCGGKCSNKENDCSATGCSLHHTTGTSFCNGSLSSCEDPISTLCVGPITSTGSFPVEDTIPHEFFQVDHPLCSK